MRDTSGLMAPFNTGERIPKTFNGGRPPGSRNRKTILSEWLSAETTATLLNGTEQNVTAEDAIVLSMIKEAKAGNVQAAAWLFDGKHGKIANVQINETNKPAFDPTIYSDEQVAAMMNIINNPANPGTRNEHIQEAEEVNEKSPDGSGL